VNYQMGKIMLEKAKRHYKKGIKMQLCTLKNYVCSYHSILIVLCFNRADPFRANFLFHLAWVINFCLRSKYWEIQNFFEIGPHLDPAPTAFLFQFPPNMLSSIDLVIIEIDMSCWYSFSLFFREKDRYTLFNDFWVNFVVSNCSSKLIN